ncbi:hypothetical protein ASD54_21675 [Rhizobium sp. Root149]|nr:hypothetical protein ASD54_21675 [Rhizobium sp. Root149]
MRDSSLRPGLVSFDGTLSAEAKAMEIDNLQHGALIMACFMGKSTSASSGSFANGDAPTEAGKVLDFLASCIDAEPMLIDSDIRVLRAFRVCPIAGS